MTTGYFFWLGTLVGRHEFRWAAAVGLGGRRVFIVPELDLVFVMNVGLYKSPMQGQVHKSVQKLLICGGLRRILPASDAGFFPVVPIKALNEYVLKAASRHSR